MIQVFDAVKDGGQRTTLKSGAQRERPGGKGRFDLIPAVPLIRLAKHYENGAKKYADRNWEKGMPLSWFLDSAFRHLIDYIGGDRSEDHLSAINWNVFGYIWTEEMIRVGRLPPELADFPSEGHLSLATDPGTTTTNGPHARTVRGARRARQTRASDSAAKARPRRVSRND